MGVKMGIGNLIKWWILDTCIFIIRKAEICKNRCLAQKLYDLAKDYDPK